MKKLVKKDKKTRKTVRLFENYKFIYKIYNQTIHFSKLSRWNFFVTSMVLPKNSSYIYINNRCILTGRKKRINKLYSFSRISFRKLIQNRNTNGLIKSSW